MVQNPSPAFLSLATGRILGHSVAGVAGDQFDIGTKVGPSVDRLGKIAPIVGGEGNGAGATVVQPPAQRPAQSPTKPGDTKAGSPASRR